MKKKVIIYIIIFLIVPIFITLILKSLGMEDYGPTTNYDSVSGTSSSNDYSYNEKQLKGSDAYIYLSAFAFVIIGASVLIYIKRKAEL